MIMTAFGWIVLLVFVGFLFKGLEDHEKRNLQKTVISTTGEQELILEMNRGSHYTVQGSINGVPCEFLLDTGATYVAVPEDLSRQANMLKGARDRSSTANGVIDVYQSTIDTLRIGPFELKNVNASILPESNQAGSILLGMSALKRFKITQHNNTLILSIAPDQSYDGALSTPISGASNE